MARVRILWLPYGGDAPPEIPFALIVDEAVSLRVIDDGAPSEVLDAAPLSVEGWRRFGQEIGARSTLVTTDRIDVAADEDVDLDGGLVLPVDPKTFGQSLAEALRDHLSTEIRRRVEEWAAATVRADTAGRGGQAAYSDVGPATP